MKRLTRALLVIAAGSLSALALVASAAGTTSAHSKKKHLQVAVAALAMDGYRIAYDASSKIATKPAPNKVLVWNVRTGKTVQVSGKKTAAADTSSTGAGVFQLALAGSRVAWLVNEGGNLEGDDYLFTSSLAHPKEHEVASEIRSGDGCPGRSTRCPGQWLGGVVGSGNLLAVNRWTTDDTGSVTAGQLDLLSGARLKRVATGAGTVQAVTADGGRVAVLRADGSVALYSAAGKLLLTVSTPGAEAVALSGKSLVVGTTNRQLKLYDAHTGSLRKTFSTRGSRQPRNVYVQGKVAIYTTGSAGELHAVNLSSRKDRVIAKPHGGIELAALDSAGLVYADNGFGTNFGKATLVFRPFARVKAAVS
jgi:archaeosine-15-forming tRNA-guanine transglycosylase